MKTYDSFIFESFDIDTNTRQIKLNYSFDDELHFTETITLADDAPLGKADSPDVTRALFALHLAGGASYFKAFAPKKIEVRSGTLSGEQVDFWNEFYTKGLGEYFYQNKMDWHGFIRFPVTQGTSNTLPHHSLHAVPKNVLVPFGFCFWRYAKEDRQN